MTLHSSSVDLCPMYNQILALNKEKTFLDWILENSVFIIYQTISVTSTNFLTLDVESCVGLAFGQNVIKLLLVLFIKIIATPQ